MTFRIILTVVISIRILSLLGKLEDDNSMSDFVKVITFILGCILNGTLIYGIWNWL